MNTEGRWAISIYYNLLVASGRLAARVRLNLVQGGQEEFRKRRRWFAPLAVRLTNLYLKATGAGLRMLPDKEWLAWEQEVHCVIGRWCHRDGDSLVTPNFKGPTVCEILRSSAPDSVKLEVMSAAVVELRRLHQRRVGGHYLTHGDAAVHNVCFSGGQAEWFDFERVHVDRDLTWRRAQDMLAFANSAVNALGAGSVGLVARSMARYQDAEVLSETARQAIGWRQRPVELQILQAPWSYTTQLLLQETLQRSKISAKNLDAPSSSLNDSSQDRLHQILINIHCDHPG